MLHAERSEDGSFRLTGHPGILNALWSVPSTLRGVIQNPQDHPEAFQRLFPSTYLDEKKEKEHRRLIGEAMQERLHQVQQRLDECRVHNASLAAGPMHEDPAALDRL